jgi:hypothetical protein
VATTTAQIAIRNKKTGGRRRAPHDGHFGSK